MRRTTLSAEAALSHGQLYSWREIETYPASCRKEANLPATVDLRGMPLARVENALAKLAEWHEILRTTYHTDTGHESGKPRQRVHDTVDLPVERVDRVVGPADVGALTEDLCAKPFPMTGSLVTGSLVWRALLVSTGGEPMLLVFALSHLICDVWSTQEIARQFQLLVADPDAPHPGTPSQTEVSATQHDPSFARRQAAAERYWHDHWADVSRSPDLLRLPTLPFTVTKGRIQATLESRRLGALATESAKRHRATAPATLLAMITAALAAHTGAHRIPVGVMSSNRFPPAYRQALGTFNQLIPVIVDVHANDTLAEHVTKVHWTVAKAYRYSCYDIDQVSPQASAHGAAASHDCWFNHQFPFWFNFVQLDDEVADVDDDSTAELAWASHPRECGQPIDIRVNLLGGVMGVRMRTDPDVIDATALSGILRTVARGTQYAATGGAGKLGDLWRHDLDDVPAALFPAGSPALVG
jgi:hypothetical protein